MEASEINNEKRIKLSNKIYPLFSGFSGDLLFWVAINTIFLTTVKGFSATFKINNSEKHNVNDEYVHNIIFKEYLCF